MESVEVVVSDNCSTDGTAQAVENYKQSIKNLTYVASTKNVGFDINIFNVVKNAHGVYCWYLGDDDIIVNGAIEFLYSQLKDKKYDFVGVNSEHLQEDSDSYKMKRNYSKESLVSINDFNDFYFKDYCQGGVSVLIFNREIWMSCVNTNDYLEHWLYYETVLKILVATKKPMAFVTETAILTGQDCRWAENGGELFTFGNSNLLLERMILFGFNKERVTNTLVSNSHKIVIILLRAKGHDLKCNFINLRYMRKTLKRAGVLNLTIATLIFFIPNFIIKMIRDIKKQILKLLKK
jgi:glycosyltransferase involved in cell wall biosynthesis